VTEPTPVPPVPDDEEEPIPERFRSFTPSEPAEIRRKMLFGVALVLAIVSVYAGLLQWGPVLQYGFGSLAAATVLVALITGATGPPRPKA
jgi:hypothetical protein